VRASLDKYQARYKRNWDSRVRPKNKDLAVGDFVYLRYHCGGHKLLPKALGPFEILDTDGTYFAIDQGDGEGRVNSNDDTQRSESLAFPFPVVAAVPAAAGAGATMERSAGAPAAQGGERWPLSPLWSPPSQHSPGAHDGQRMPTETEETRTGATAATLRRRIAVPRPRSMGTCN